MVGMTYMSVRSGLAQCQGGGIDLDKAIHVPVGEFCDLKEPCLNPVTLLLHLMNGHEKLDDGFQYCLAVADEFHVIRVGVDVDGSSLASYEVEEVAERGSEGKGVPEMIDGVGRLAVGNAVEKDMEFSDAVEGCSELRALLVEGA